MNFEEYIRSNYVAACHLQRNDVQNGDEKIQSMLASGVQDISIVKSWMRNYSLLQGITAENRDKIAKRFLSFSKSASPIANVANGKILEEKYTELFKELFSEVNRSWMSATSKLLWCIYPNEVAIYDSFVWRALVVIQCLDSELAGFQRIGEAPKVERESDIVTAVRHYMNYQQMVMNIFKRNSGILKELREKHNEKYPHDIRIIDKLLWMIGNPNYESFVAKQTNGQT